MDKVQKHNSFNVCRLYTKGRSESKRKFKRIIIIIIIIIIVVAVSYYWKV
jgi:hypothetical protein